MQIDKNMIDKLDDTITIRDMITLMGGHVMDYPVIGTTITLNGKRTGQHDIRDEGNISISYEWTGDNVDTQTLCRIYIGHKYAGPMLSLSNTASISALNTDDKRAPVCGDWEWHNLYSNGNHGNNITCGGTWASNSKRAYKSALAAMGDRDYEVTGIECKQAYLEGRKLLDEVIAFVKDLA